MFLARTEDEQGRPIIGIGLGPADLQRLRANRPWSFALGDAQIHGPEATERVLIAYASPAQMELMRQGYFPGLTDARILIYVDYESAKRLKGGGYLSIYTPGTPVHRFLVFPGETFEDARLYFGRAGLRIRQAGPPIPLTADRIEAMAASVAPIGP